MGLKDSIKDSFAVVDAQVEASRIGFSDKLLLGVVCTWIVLFSCGIHFPWWSYLSAYAIMILFNVFKYDKSACAKSATILLWKVVYGVNESG